MRRCRFYILRKDTMGLLNYVGSKERIAYDIIQHFPEHKYYIELFFGSGGLFFKKPRAHWNLVNDKDNEIFESLHL